MSFGFDPNKFKSANAASPDFKAEVPPGYYIVKFLELTIGPSKGSGRLQAYFKYKIDEDDQSEWVGKFVNTFVGLTDKAGNQQDQGYDALMYTLRAMGFTQAELDECNSQQALENLVNSAAGSKYKLHVEEKDGFTKHRIKSCTFNSRMEAVATDYYKEQASQAVTTPTVPSSPAPIVSPTKVSVTTNKTVTVNGKTGELIFEDAANNQGIVLFGDATQEMFPLDQIQMGLVENTPVATTEEDVVVEEEEEVSTKTLEVGSKVSFSFKGEVKEGEVAQLIDDATVKVKSGDKNYRMPKTALTLL